MIRRFSFLYNHFFFFQYLLISSLYQLFIYTVHLYWTKYLEQSKQNQEREDLL